MRSLSRDARHERRVQVIRLRKAGGTYDEIAAQTGLSRTGVFDICKRHEAAGAKALRDAPSGRKSGDGRLLDAAQSFDETRVVLAGVEPAQFTLVARNGQRWTVGLSICYDLRFPELYRWHAAQGADLLLVPSAFTHATGQAHWELLLRARAVENLAYVLAPAQGGLHENGRRTWGHSMVVDPWGEVMAVQAEGAAVVLAQLDQGRIAQVRTRLPALAHRVLLT